MDGSAPYNARSVEQVFRDFKGRRAGIIKALTADVEDFYQQCDPKENLCLYGFPNEQWEFPEPALGNNFARDGCKKDWISLVAVHSDAWLLAERLFTIINDLPTIFEVVTEKEAGQNFRQEHAARRRRQQAKSNSKPVPKPGNPRKKDEMDDDEAAAGEEDDDDDDDDTGRLSAARAARTTPSDEFWICCDITPAKAEHIKQYKCPTCTSSKRVRPS
ncbi:unnamed protein product [Spirodela intermedia]|uniref:PHD finger protein ALFIN-LIKE n=1 Tax=Spirodela intermedia TaxID=51605 RepID=A0ABN7E9I2_SPIIN|nr:unnamed protein product [Spirodela intermedia]